MVLANPPFGGKERSEVQQNFPVKTGETASLFLQHLIKILKAGGKEKPNPPKPDKSRRKGKYRTFSPILGFRAGYCCPANGDNLG